MGDGGRTITNDPEMLRNTGSALISGPDDVYLDSQDTLSDVESPCYPESFTEFASDKDPRTQQFSQCYGHLSYSLFRVDQIVTLGERFAVRDNLEKMASNFAATEDENKRDVFSVKLPPKLMG
jgi:hypothetical protein